MHALEECFHSESLQAMYMSVVMIKYMLGFMRSTQIKQIVKMLILFL